MAKKIVAKKAKTEVIPLGERVLISEIDEKETQTASGILLPDSVENDKGLKRGLVVAVGGGKYDDGVKVPMQVKKGDIVLYAWGDVVSIDNVDYVLVRESEISAIVK